MAVDPQPCGIGSVEPPLVDNDGVLSIAPGEDGQVLATEGGEVVWVDPGAATGEVSSIIAVAPLLADQPTGDVTLSMDVGADGTILAGVGGVAQWVDPAGMGIATEQYVLDQVSPVQSQVTTNTTDIGTLGSAVSGLDSTVGGLSTDVGNLSTAVDGKVDAGGGGPLRIWPVIDAADPTPVGAVDGDVILRRTA